MYVTLLYICYCVSNHPDDTIIKFADGNTAVGLISGGNETTHREEFTKLKEWCTDNILVIIASETKEVVVDFRRRNLICSPSPAW